MLVKTTDIHYDGNQLKSIHLRTGTVRSINKVTIKLPLAQISDIGKYLALTILPMRTLS